MNIRKIVVPHLGRKQYKKNYITKRVPPPSLWQNKWYFQQDMCNLPLFILKTCAVSLDQFYQPDTQLSNNITLVTLNTDMFQNPHWETEENVPYYPKVTGTQNTGLYTFGNGGDPNTLTNWQTLWPLYNTKHWVQKAPNAQIKTFTEQMKQNNWGNPFTERNAHVDQDLYFTNTWPSATQYEQEHSFTPLEYIYWQCRYNPEKDTGEGNKIYLVQNYAGSNWDEPQNPNLILDGFPLYNMVWGFTDWQKK